MPSQSLMRWRTDARDALDQIQNAHAAVGGSERGRRYATLQINHAYLVLVSSYFQRFCRDLHTESIDYLCGQGAVPDLRRDVLRQNLARDRRLDRGNPSPASIGADFNRFNIEFWDVVKQRAPTYNGRRQQVLEDMNNWRNAIAHQDFANHNLRPQDLTLARVTAFRNACDNLAERFDVVVANHLATITGAAPW